MNTLFSRGMSRATELTRSGRLDEATALIRSLLQPTSAGEQPASIADESLVIDGTFHPLGEATTVAKPHAGRSNRKGLGETLRWIAKGGMPACDMPNPAPPDLPVGAQFLASTHRSAHGSRDYRLYVPATRPKERMPLIVMLHGCTQSPEDFAQGTGMNALAEEFGCLVAWPAQPQGANVQKCWNWFRPEDQERDRGEPALIAGIVRDILRDHSADPMRIYAAGLSAGGAAAAIMGAAYPDLFAAVGVHSGLPVGGARDVPSAFAAMRGGATGKAQPVAVPTIVFHGLADSTVHPTNGTAIVAQVLEARPGLKRVLRSGTSDRGCRYRQTRYDDNDGQSIAEHWEIEGRGHAWAGGHAGGSYTDPTGPDASREMLRFFRQHRQM